MTTTRKRLATAATARGRAVNKAVAKGEHQLKQKPVRRKLHQAGEAVLTAGAALVASKTMHEAEKFVRGRLDSGRRVGVLGFTVALPVDHERAIAGLTDALGSEGFGIITRTDLQATFKAKLGVEFRSCTLLGVCNPALAHRALTADPEAGLLLPCTVTVEEGGEGTTVIRIADPQRIFPTGLRRRRALAQVADEASAGLARVAKRLSKRA